MSRLRLWSLDATYTFSRRTPLCFAAPARRTAAEVSGAYASVSKMMSSYLPGHDTL